MLLSLVLTSFLFGCGTNNGATEEPIVDNNQGNTEEITTDPIETETIKVQVFELEIDLVNNEEIDIEYKNRNQSANAEIERKTAEGKEEIKGEQAATEVEELLQQLALDSSITADEAVEKVLSTMNISRDDIRKLELEVDFLDGEKLKANL
ncbi:hypothetical protein JCM9140_4939 [Halalkalibacter wakoensis JCM 9140]|uniref:Uncharacterized protein n=1 Tax=Halalkalibacter wakoensis JCM 9140 TaxID=1236970 RepID=W4QB95_9BACI|nr:hypothetical protein JCM9140_4939 [Halalkalibacter wakoensis JCM 9140]